MDTTKKLSLIASVTIIFLSGLYLVDQKVNTLSKVEDAVDQKKLIQAERARAEFIMLRDPKPTRYQEMPL